MGNNTNEKSAAPPNKSEPQTQKQKTIDEWAKLYALVAAAAIALVFIGLLIGVSDELDTGRSGRSSTYTQNTVKQGTFGAINEEVYSRMQTLAVAGDDSGFSALQRLGLVFYLEAGTQFRMIDLGFGNARSRSKAVRMPVAIFLSLLRT
jgi:hypothetical protein